MVYIPPGFEAATVPANEAYEGTELDDAVKAALPQGATIKWVATYYPSFWAISYKIDTVLCDGSSQFYFLKVYNTEYANEMALGEYEGSKALYKALPENVPRPIAAGALASDAKKHFYLAEFKNITDEMPETSKFVSVIAKLHQTTESPNGKFGFHVTTYGGDQAVDTSWCDTWEEFFTRLMKNTMKKERLVQGPNDELDKLSPLILGHVIPRLLRPLESDGRQVKPVLVHGDLWHGNVAVDNETGEPIVYDPCAFYAHNEYDFALWRAARYRTNRQHVQEYYEVTETTKPGEATRPTEEEDDRHALYAMRSDLMVSISWSANKQTRQLAIDAMRRLAEKYCKQELNALESGMKSGSVADLGSSSPDDRTEPNLQ
ncbi:Fructosamine kinase-domain-containing protein [Astrocystis sublimbata]|nr:Fructosamine kinase-domain-containing protein [Astrocystis sublimbata]